MSVVFYVKLLNILGIVHLPEKVLDKYFEIKGVLNLITCSMLWGGGGGGGGGDFCQNFKLLNSITKG